MQVNILLLHFRPLPLYPPILNFLDFLSTKSNLEVTVITSHTNKAKLPIYQNVQIIEAFDYESISSSKFKKLRYLNFYLQTLKQLVIRRYRSVLFYESISVPGLWLAKKFGLIHTSQHIAGHYHEYFSPSDMKKQMGLERLGYFLENNVLRVCNWISHTNDSRRAFFLRDKSFLNDKIVFTLPNYPPSSWSSEASSDRSGPIKLVYVGALSTTSMYFEEVSNWISTQKGRFTLDVFSLNLRKDVTEFITKLNCPDISLKDAVDYSRLPSILSRYDIGLVLYNGSTLNYIYNAPNKLFEYWACGLDVWFSSDLITSKKYVTQDVYPKIIEVNFKELEKFDWNDAIDRKYLNYQPSPYYSETVLTELYNRLVKS
jgi:hypothetical protein